MNVLDILLDPLLVVGLDSGSLYRAIVGEPLPLVVPVTGLTLPPACPQNLLFIVFGTYHAKTVSDIRLIAR